MGIPGKGKPRRSAHTNLLLQSATHVPSEYVPSEHLVRSLRARHLTPQGTPSICQHVSPALASPPTAHHALFFSNASAAVSGAVHSIGVHEHVCTSNADVYVCMHAGIHTPADVQRPSTLHMLRISSRLVAWLFYGRAARPRIPAPLRITVRAV